MLQDIAPHRLSNEYPEHAALFPDGNALLLIRGGGKLLCRIEEGRLTLPGVPPEGQGPAGIQKGRFRYLIAVDGHRFYMPAGEETELLQELLSAGFSFVPAAQLRYAGPDWLRFGALTAWQAAGWYRNNAFCGRCGSPVKESGAERALVCPSCGNTVYPKLCPVVITGVICGERILLTKYASGSGYRKYALVAGFAEIGETIEETVSREVQEETGLRIKNLRYYKSQPWAYSESLLFGFFCEAEDPSELLVDRKELSLAEWKAREEIPVYEGEISLTYEMMCRFRERAEITVYNGTGNRPPL